MRAHPNIFLLVGEIVLIGASGFVAGFLWPHPSPELTLSVPPTPVIEIGAEPSQVESAQAQKPQGQFIASKSGTKYHPASGCSYADRIKEENRIYFRSAAEAEAAGYEPSSCITK
ncbi:MAG: hypothetical protein U0517_00155 [Candidatus Andersenbacteria bacterium]